MKQTVWVTRRYPDIEVRIHNQDPTQLVSGISLQFKPEEAKRLALDLLAELAPHPDDIRHETCERAPLTWWCSLEVGHTEPCELHPLR